MPLGGKIIGIDLSNNNSVNPHEVVADFVYHKATEGETFTDQFYAERLRVFEARGIPVGAYHYARVHEDPKKQVDFFVKTAHLGKGMLIPFVDVEGQGNEGADGKQWREWLDKWFSRIGAYPPFGHRYRCGIYVAPSFADFYSFKLSPRLALHPLFVAQWNVGFPHIPKPWSHAWLWQFTATASVPGVGGHCDADEWFPRCDQFAAWKLQH